MYELVSYGKNMIIVENITTKKRMPAYTRDKIVSLGDIAIYTYGEEVPLAKVLTSVYEKHDGKEVDAKQYATAASLQAFIAEVLPEYDKERVHNNDIKKLISWYNMLLAAGIKTFEEPKQEAQESAE